MYKIVELNDKYFKYYNNLFNYDINLLYIVIEKLLFSQYKVDEDMCNINIDKTFNDNYLRYMFNSLYRYSRLSTNYQVYIIIKYIGNVKNFNTLTITYTPSIISNFDIFNPNIIKNLDIFVLPAKHFDDKTIQKYMDRYNKSKNIQNIYSSYYLDDFKKNILNLLQKNNKPLINKKYHLITSHAGYSLFLPHSASYKMVLHLPYILASIGIAFKTLEKGGTLLLFWTIINVNVPSVKKILTILSHAFDNIKVITDDINQNFFQSIPEYYIKCTGYKNNLSDELINSLLQISLDTIDYSYEICEILDYYEKYSREEPKQCLFYKHNTDNTDNTNITNNQHTRKKASGKSKSLQSHKSFTSFIKLSRSKTISSKSKTKTKNKTISSRSKTKKTTQKKVTPIKYIEDFNFPNAEYEEIIKNDTTYYKTMLLSMRLENIFIDCFETINNMILNDLEEDTNSENKGKMRVKPDAIVKRNVNDIKRFVNMLETNKIPYNKHLLTIMKQQEDEYLETFYSFGNIIDIDMIKYNDNETKALLRNRFANFRLCNPYKMEQMTTSFDRINATYTVKDNLLTLIGVDRAPIQVRAAYEDFTRSLAQFITDKYIKTLPHSKVSNAFIKMWEILAAVGNIIKPGTNKKFKVFHICEAPGQMILATKYYTEKKVKNIDIGSYDWRANSLNPFNLTKKAEHGKFKIFGDDYGLIKGNPRKWLWGADNTGDITKPENIKWFRRYIRKEWLKLDSSGNTDAQLNLITGDAGLNTEMDPLLLQKLDLAQVIMVLACSSKGGSCIIKHFTPYIKRHTETYNAAGFFIGFIYLYYLAFDNVKLFKPYSSNPDSGEFYIIGQGFNGVNDDELQKLYKILENFEYNNAIIEKQDIPEKFIYQITNFLVKLSDLNVIALEKQNLLLTCYKDGKNEKIQKYLKCNNFLDNDNLQNILIPRFNQWIKKYGFQ
jgi:23S rRNA U2552 (ribose-2'-O)-methylase RlmE/FtsJ